MNQEELIQFTSSMPIKMNKRIAKENFKKALSKSISFIGLRIHLRDYFRKKEEQQRSRVIIDINTRKIDSEKGEKEFNKLISTITDKLELDFVKPEQIIVA